ncbi:MAG: hypothetical protein ACREX8_05225, partial [Gammaproteobacteria bacterium]
DHGPLTSAGGLASGHRILAYASPTATRNPPRASDLFPPARTTPPPTGPSHATIYVAKLH